MSDRPETSSLSVQLKYLDETQPALPPAGFGVDDVVRGGRRRRRNRTIVQTAAAFIGVTAVSIATVTALTVPNTRVDPPPAATAPSTAPLPTLNLTGDTTLTYKQNKDVVTITQKGTTVATMKLTNYTHTHTSAHATFSLTSTHPTKIDTNQFAVYVADGEFQIDRPTTSTLPPGTHTLTINATDIGSEPRGIAWNVGGDVFRWIRP